MTFVWPSMLLSLATLPVMVLSYWVLLRRRARRRAALAALGLVAPTAVSSGWRRHVPAVLLLGAMTLLLTALARPTAEVAQPRLEGTVVLAFDVSASMNATDIAPSRMAAAKSAARAFVARQPPRVKIGVVAFSGSGLITQQPTTNRRLVVAAINRLTATGGTALGRGLQTALTAITGKTVQVDASSDSLEPKGQNLGWHGSAAVILLSDGENNVEPDPIDVAEIASTTGVRVYPIGLGSREGAVLEIGGFRVATALDEQLLRKIATTTDARYFAAEDEKALASIYRSIDLAWTVEAEQVEVTALFAAAAAVLLLLGTGLSLAWFGRVV